MGLNKKLSAIESQYEEFKNALQFMSSNFTALRDKLEVIKAHVEPQRYRRIIAIRNWITHILLWCILVLLLSSCFVSGRTIHISTPKVQMTADTATAYSWPYQSNGNPRY